MKELLSLKQAKRLSEIMAEQVMRLGGGSWELPVAIEVVISVAKEKDCVECEIATSGRSIVKVFLLPEDK